MSADLASDPAQPSRAERLRRAAPVLGAVLVLALLAFGIGWTAARLAAEPPGTAAASGEAARASRAVAALEARVARLEAEQALVARVSAAGLAVVNLTAAAENAAGFAAALQAAERVLPASPDLQALRPLAVEGAPTRAGLAEAFPAAAARARAAMRGQGGGEALGGFSRALDRFFGREPPEPRGLSPEAVMARAEAHLAKDDLAGAADVLTNLPPPARAAFEPWSAGARRRVEIDRRLAAVRLLALNQFAAVPGEAAPKP